MFADGTHLFVSDFDIENLFETMSKELRKRTTWFKASNVSLHISKTKYCLFYSLKKSFTKYLTSIAHRQSSNQRKIFQKVSRSILK